jgi:hypothetical protein
MKPLYNNVNISNDEIYYYLELSDAQKIHYLFQLFDREQKKLTSKNLDLSGFFNSLNGSLDANTDPDFNRDAEENQQLDPNLENHPGRVDILIDNNNLMIESNSLKAIRHIIYRFIESGYILRRDLQLEKIFKRDKVTKYLRIFSIVDQTNQICIN